MKSLKIQNLILIEKAEIEFGPGLNIITGETGSGKSAILSAIRLISGERADATCIRKGAEMAVIEAVFEGPLFIRREIHRSGKNRCFIDDSQVTLAQLREIADIEMVDQSSSQTLVENQKRMIDSFGNLTSEAQRYEASYQEEKEWDEELLKLQQIPKDRELEWAQKDLALIEEVNWQPGEEQKLAEEHHFLTHAQELVEKISAVAYALTEGGEVASLKRIATILDHAVRFDAKIAPLSQGFKSALLEIEETARSVQSYSDKLETNPDRLIAVEKRISAIESLKRRFGPDIEAQKKMIQSKLDHLLNLESEIKSLESKLHSKREKNRAWALAITEKRKREAIPFTSRVLSEIKSLNIPHAQFEIAIGDQYNEIQFRFSANPGLPPLPLNQCASGGELSRLLLAIKTILADGKSCLVFDEIDSNVGGQTAAILGEKLKKLSEKRQVICVTHFVQVAKCALEHFLVSKIEKNSIAYTTIEKLDSNKRFQEYERMLGNRL